MSELNAEQIKKPLEEYMRGYEQGVEDFKARLTKYYRMLPGNTLSAVAEYTITLMAKELIDKAGEASDKA